MRYCSKLTLVSVKYIIDNAAKITGTITVTVHPDVYAKLTDAVNYPEWAAVTELAATKNIIFATT